MLCYLLWLFDHARWARTVPMLEMRDAQEPL